MVTTVCVRIKFVKFLSVMTKLHASNKFYIGNYLTILTINPLGKSDHLREPLGRNKQQNEKLLLYYKPKKQLQPRTRK